MQNTRLFFLLSVLFLSCFWFGSKTELKAQSLFVEQASTTVEVEQDNLALAKQKALKEAKELVVLQALGRFLEQETIKVLQTLLDKQFIDRPDVFIESTRIIDEGNTEDLKEFDLTLEARIFRSRLLAAFRKLGLPTQSEQTPFKDAYLIYNSDDFMHQRSEFKKVVSDLKALFKAYRIRLKVITVKSKTLMPLEDGLSSRMELLSAKKFKNKKTKTPILEIKFEHSPVSETNKNATLNTELIFWAQHSPFLENNKFASKISTSNTFKKWQPEVVLPEIMDTLLLQWTPMIQKIKAMAQGESSAIRIKISGIPGPMEEQIFLKTMFQNKSSWKKVQLQMISREFVLYQSIFSGNRKTILKKFKPPLEAPFKFRKLSWDGGILAIDLEWKEQTAILEPYIVVPGGGEQLDLESGETIPEPFLRVPLTPIKKTYILPLSTAVYDHIRHRGDSTLFQVKIPKKYFTLEQEKKVSVSWYRNGVSNLRPAITLYDQDREKLSFLQVKKRKIFRFQYVIPEMQNVFYLRVADETGFLQDIAGSYQSFRYIIEVQ